LDGVRGGLVGAGKEGFDPAEEVLVAVACDTPVVGFTGGAISLSVSMSRSSHIERATIIRMNEAMVMAEICIVLFIEKPPFLGTARCL